MPFRLSLQTNNVAAVFFFSYFEFWSHRFAIRTGRMEAGCSDEASLSSFWPYTCATYVQKKCLFHSWYLTASTSRPYRFVEFHWSQSSMYTCFCWEFRDMPQCVKIMETSLQTAASPWRFCGTQWFRDDFELWHPRCVLLTMYNWWMCIPSWTQQIIVLLYQGILLMTNYMFRPSGGHHQVLNKFVKTEHAILHFLWFWDLRPS
jgi:hypothetical protein